MVYVKTYIFHNFYNQYLVLLTIWSPVIAQEPSQRTALLQAVVAQYLVCVSVTYLMYGG